MLRKFLISFFMFMFTTINIWAEDISFTSTVSNTRVAMNESVQLTLTVNGYKDNIDPVNLPVIDGFDAKYLGPSTKISIDNGAYHSERSFLYELFPTKVGHFQIPAITTTIAGAAYTTKPIDIDVVKDAGGAGSTDTGVPTADTLKDKVMLAMATPRTDVYQGEKIPLVIRLYVRDVPIRDLQMPTLNQDGFVTDGFVQPRQFMDTLNGMNYNVVEFRTNIYPTHTGPLTVTPAQIQGNVLYKPAANPKRDAIIDEFFGNFVDSYSARPITVTSEGIKFNVEELPPNAPAHFSNAVGAFQFQASVSPSNVKVGDPLTMRMKITGTGNLKGAKLPQLKDAHFKTYDPQIKDEGDGKTIEQVIIPISAEVKEVPAIDFSYFDPQAKEYKTITQGPFPITVENVKADDDFKAVGFNDLTQQKVLDQKAPGESQPHMIHSIQTSAGQLLHNWIFWFCVIVFILNVIIWNIWKAFSKRLAEDIIFARRFRASKQAKDNLKKTKEAMEDRKPKDFYGHITSTLTTLVADKTGQSAGTLHTPEIVQILKHHNIDQSKIEALQNLFNKSDLIRYASAPVDQNEMQSDYTQTEELVEHLDKKLS